MKIKVENLNGIKNQFRISTNKGVYFQSYDRIILFIHKDGKIELDYKWNFSPTTSKYRNLFLGETTKETEKKIKEGIYILTDLN